MRRPELAEQSEGAFDITVGPYVKLWRRARREKEMPPAERMAEARAGGRLPTCGSTLLPARPNCCARHATGPGRHRRRLCD